MPMSEKRQHRLYHIAAHAIELFSKYGVNAVTAEEVAEASGVSVRTFFRYFLTKEAAVFPDHHARLADIELALEFRQGAADPLLALTEVGGLLTRDFFASPELFRRRYQLITVEPSLAERERLLDVQYEKLLAAYLRREMPVTPESEMIAAIVAAGIVAAVNSVLSTWAAGDCDDPQQRVTTAMQMIYRGAQALYAGNGSNAGQSGKARWLQATSNGEAG